MAEQSTKLASAKAIFSTVASVAATTMVVRSVIMDYMPDELQYSLVSYFRKFFHKWNNEMTMVIEEFDGLMSNEIYSAAESYLAPKISPATRRLRISKKEKENEIKMSMEKGEMITDDYNGQKMKWICVINTTLTDLKRSSDLRSFELCFHKRNMEMVINSYLPSIVEELRMKKLQKRSVKIHAIDPEHLFETGNLWKPVNLDHPATFDTIAMDPELKKMILNDLEMFVKRRDYYKSVGKAWKRGYLLYGPPGTGKSSLIAAMANFLKFDIYDLELTEIRTNSDLKKLFMATANKSILVVEDIDCTIDLRDRKITPSPYGSTTGKVTLSGFLNFIDGLWSSCGDERIIIFTTNHKDKIDSALLRPGRMDVHIHMSYCSPCGFKLLAKNYLGLDDHPLFKETEELIETAKVTPSEIAEQLLKQNDPDASLQCLIEFLHEYKKKQAEEPPQQEKEDEQQQENEEMVEYSGIENLDFDSDLLLSSSLRV